VKPRPNPTVITDRSATRGVTEKAACRRLHDLAMTVPADHAIVELGAFQGRTTGWLTLGAWKGNGAHVTAVDPWDALDHDAVTDEYATVEPHYATGVYTASRSAWFAHARHARLHPGVTPLRATARQAAAMWVQPVGLLFHDAVHTADDVEADLRAWAPHVAAGGAVALHDIGQVAFGVDEGAGRVLDTDEWDWAGRERLLWKRHPDRRGLMVVHRRG
jgi:hypothetical protein